MYKESIDEVQQRYCIEIFHEFYVYGICQSLEEGSGLGVFRLIERSYRSG